MKILHTSDWHLGQTFYDYDRSAEQQDMLLQIADIARQEQPDAMVVCGDVFHTGNPSSKTIEIYNRALLAMREACPSMQIIVTAGNHDSASRLVVNNDLWDFFNVNIIGNVAKNKDENRTPDFDRHIIKICAKDGTAIGFIAAVPHCYESNFPSQNSDLQREERVKAYFQGLSDRIRELNTNSLPVVLMAHLAVSDCDTAGHDNIGGMESHDSNIFGSGFDYVALGHIHTPQNIDNKVRYSGTPIPVNFGEKYEHSVSIVSIKSGEKPIITTKAIKNLVPLQDFPSEPKPFNEVWDALREFPDNKCCYLRLLVKVDETMTPLANTLVAEAIKEKQCRVCRIQTFTDSKNEIDSSKRTVRMSGGDLETKTPLEIAELFFAMKGQELSDRQREMIKLATRIAEENKKEDNDDEA